MKYRRDVFTPAVSKSLKEVCLEFGPAYEIHFLEIGIDENHVHFLIQTIPSISPSDLANIIKGNISPQFFIPHPEGKVFLLGGSLWTDGYYVNTVDNTNMSIVKNYVQKQGLPEYT